MADKRTYTAVEIANMTPEQRSAAWHNADSESQKSLHAANQTAYRDTHTYDAGSGTWTRVNSNPTGVTPTRRTPYTADDISDLAGGYNFNEKRIRALFDNATEKEYASKRVANQAAQNQFAGNVGGYINTLSDTMRQSLNKAVATGGSRGLAAAQAMQAAQDATMQTADEANALSLERMQLDYDEAAAYTANAKAAEALAQERRSNAMQQGIQLGQLDTQAYAAEHGTVGNYYYGGDAARENAGAQKTTNLTNIKTTGMNNATSELSYVLGLVQNGNFTPEGLSIVEQLLGYPAGTLQQTPTPTYSRNGGYNSSGGYAPSGDTPSSTSGNPYLDFGNTATADKRQQLDALNTFMVKGNEAAWVALYAELEGVSERTAKNEYHKLRSRLFNTDEKPVTSSAAGGRVNTPMYHPQAPGYGK